MRAWQSGLALLMLLSACQRTPMMMPRQPSDYATQSLDANTAGGLPASAACRASVQLARPLAFALSPEAGPFLAALEQTVVPQRLTLARHLAADPLVAGSLEDWAQIGPAGQIRALRRIAAIQGQVMGCKVPPVIENRGEPTQPGLTAYYQPDQNGLGQVVIFPKAVATGGKYLAVSTLIHEIRHAAQFQLASARNAATRPDGSTLAVAYAESWKAAGELGGEAKMSYGDYAHLNIEFDAFQSGNQVAALLSGGEFDSLGFGFVDTHYRAGGVPALRLLPMMQALQGPALVAAVNQAQYQAERSAGITPARFRAPAAQYRRIPQLNSLR